MPQFGGYVSAMERVDTNGKRSSWLAQPYASLVERNFLRLGSCWLNMAGAWSSVHQKTRLCVHTVEVPHYKVIVV